MQKDQDLLHIARGQRQSKLKATGWRAVATMGAAACAIFISGCASTPLPPMAPYPAPGTPAGSMPPGTAPGMPGASSQPVQPGAALPGSSTAPMAARFIRPTNGTVVARFDGKDNKGIDIAGQLGDPVVASAAGRVVYVGDELRNYGNLIIVDHGDNFLTAYAHNRIVMVQERQSVTQGQKIGEIGRNSEGTPMLHFEIRRNGVPVDPSPYLAGMQP